MEDRKSLIEEIIRDEVRKFINLSPVPEDDLPIGEEVPASDLPTGILEDTIGVSNNEDIKTDATLTQLKAGSKAEPNEALQASALDPLTNIGLGAIVRGATKAPSAYTSRVENVANKRVNEIKSNLRKKSASDAENKMRKSFGKEWYEDIETYDELITKASEAGLSKDLTEELLKSSSLQGGVLNKLADKTGIGTLKTISSAIDKSIDPVASVLGYGPSAMRMTANKPAFGQGTQKLKSSVNKLFGETIRTSPKGSSVLEFNDAIEAILKNPNSSLSEKTLQSLANQIKRLSTQYNVGLSEKEIYNFLQDILSDNRARKKANNGSLSDRERLQIEKDYFTKKLNDLMKRGSRND